MRILPIGWFSSRSCMPSSRPFTRFWMGTARLGRMLVPLFLWQHDLIRAPMFYVSAHFEARRDAYYDGLLGVSRDDDWTGWVEFFLTALREQAEDNLQKTKGILDLYENMKTQVAEMTRSQYAIRALDWIFERPIFSSSHFRDAAGVPRPSVQRILADLRDGDILRVIVPSRGRRAAVLVLSCLAQYRRGTRGILTLTNDAQTTLRLMNL